MRLTNKWSGEEAVLLPGPRNTTLLIGLSHFSSSVPETRSSCIYVTALPQMVDMAERFPRARIILDHLARPVLEDGPPYTTADSLLALARYPNVYLKPTCVYRKPHPL